jgi:formylmethanofuran dehydrogenase subunit A
MSLTLSYHAQTSVPVEIEGVVPDRLRDKSLAEIERICGSTMVTRSPSARAKFGSSRPSPRGTRMKNLPTRRASTRASISSYPQIIRLLMDRTARQDLLKTVPRKVREQSALADIDREYSLSEIAIITRAGPARILGLAHKGHLGPGADADITIDTPNANRETMFELPRFVIKAGTVIVEEGEIRKDLYGKTLHVAPEYNRGVEPDIQKWFEDSYSIQWRNYPVDVHALHEHEVVG